LVLVFTVNYFIACELGKTFLWSVKGMKVKIFLWFVMSVNFLYYVVVKLILFLELILHLLFESLAHGFIVTFWKHLLKLVKNSRQLDCFKKCTINDLRSSALFKIA
jgi:hypothetical protein